jgi:ornithine carbamoyltransferase
MTSTSLLSILTSEALTGLIPATLKGRSILKITDFSTEEIHQLLALAKVLKKARRAKQPHPLLAGQQAMLYFEQPSCRTRISFETALADLGMNALFVKKEEIGLGKREAIADVARTLSRYVDAIIIRHLNDAEIAELAQWATIPVVNALSASHHPCQALADLLTIQDCYGNVTGKRVVFMGDIANNVAVSLLQACMLAGVHMVLCGPKNASLNATVLSEAAAVGAVTGATLTVQPNPQVAVATADVIYTDVFTSMGQEAENHLRLGRFRGYQVNEGLMAQAPQHAIVLHCLPAHRGEEITHGVVEAHAQWLFEQAENRHHVQKALMLALLH